MAGSGTRPPFTAARVPNNVPSLDVLLAAYFQWYYATRLVQSLSGGQSTR
jgi:hypothetical protein